jgi:hypothetical protein
LSSTANSTPSAYSVTYASVLPTIPKPVRTGYTFGGYYTGTEGTGTQIYNSSAVALSTWSIASNTTIYAYWTANTYRITLDKQSGSVLAQVAFAASSTLTSSSSNEIVYISFVSSTSGTITLWTSHTSGDPYLHLYNSSYSQLTYNDDDYGNYDSKITYSVTGGIRYYVGFRAYSVVKTVGNIYYSGVSLTSTTASIIAKYGSVLPVVPIPMRSGYAFAGYYTGANGSGTRVYDSNGNGIGVWNIPSNTTLYALWSATLYAYTASVNTTIYGSTSIVDLTNAPEAGTYVFYISSTVSEVTFKSNSKTFSSMRIIVNYRTSPLVLRLSSTSIKAPTDYNAISATGNFKLTFAYEGTCNVTGGNNTTVGTGQGYAAVYNATSGATVALKGIGALTLTGGIGSTGVVGTTGTKGADGKDVTGIILGNGGNGSAGTDGKEGGTGGKGGYAVYASYLIIESTSGTIDLCGGKGGTGGAGGKGGEGGRGGHGAGSAIIAMNGGDGGVGGKGGTGGAGGVGGAYSNVSYSKSYSSCVTPSTSTGLQGNGGRGGDGGNGGAGGANGPSLFASGSHGSGGAGGSGGDGGSGSTDGSTGSSGYTGSYWYR